MSDWVWATFVLYLWDPKALIYIFNISCLYAIPCDYTCPHDSPPPSCFHQPLASLQFGPSDPHVSLFLSSLLFLGFTQEATLSVYSWCNGMLCLETAPCHTPLMWAFLENKSNCGIGLENLECGSLQCSVLLMKIIDFYSIHIHLKILLEPSLPYIFYAMNLNFVPGNIF